VLLVTISASSASPVTKLWILLTPKVLKVIIIILALAVVIGTAVIVIIIVMRESQSFYSSSHFCSKLSAASFDRYLFSGLFIWYMYPQIKLDQSLFCYS
jgi:hypothetical protein